MASVPRASRGVPKSPATTESGTTSTINRAKATSKQSKAARKAEPAAATGDLSSAAASGAMTPCKDSKAAQRLEPAKLSSFRRDEERSGVAQNGGSRVVSSKTSSINTNQTLPEVGAPGIAEAGPTLETSMQECRWRKAAVPIVAVALFLIAFTIAIIISNKQYRISISHSNSRATWNTSST